MKQAILISMMCIGSMAGFAQTTQNDAANSQAVCRKYPGMPAGATAAWPKSEYVSKVNPQCAPCYTYTRKSGLAVMECPGLWFVPTETVEKTVDAGWDNTTPVHMQTTSAYTGNYPKVCKRDARMPKNATPAFPESTYTPTQDPSCAPCYTYKRKSGLEVMECPFLYFPPEK